MKFDPENNVIKLCALGMACESEGKRDEAFELFQRAWNESTNDFEKFTSAHYVARHQSSIEDKLKWDETALSFALKTDDNDVKASLPSLYLNIAKCYEDIKDLNNAKKNYQLAQSFSSELPDDGYGKMIKAGINNGIGRLS
jgi:tetratricopeptide (TPR) repeat protein